MLQPVLPILSSVVANNGHWYNEKTFQETEQKNLPPRKLNKNSLTKLNTFFWHLVSTFLNLNGCIHGAFSKFIDLDLQFCRSLCMEVIWRSKVTLLGISTWFFPDLQQHNNNNKKSIWIIHTTRKQSSSQFWF